MTDMIPGGKVVLKSDKLGRVRTPAARRNEVLDQFEQSGLSGVKFAELVGIKYQTLATWVRKRRAQPVAQPTGKAPSVQWLETVVDSAEVAPMVLVVQLPGGARLEVNDQRQAALAAVLVRNLAQLC